MFLQDDILFRDISTVIIIVRAVGRVFMTLIRRLLFCLSKTIQMAVKMKCPDYLIPLSHLNTHHFTTLHSNKDKITPPSNLRDAADLSGFLYLLIYLCVSVCMSI